MLNSTNWVIGESTTIYSSKMGQTRFLLDKDQSILDHKELTLNFKEHITLLYIGENKWIII